MTGLLCFLFIALMLLTAYAGSDNIQSGKVTNQNTQQAGVILDEFSYQIYKDLMPVFYDVTVSQKGLRNEESIEMFGISEIQGFSM